MSLRRSLVRATCLVALGPLAYAACGTATVDPDSWAAAGAADGGGSSSGASPCVACQQDSECQGGVCGQIAFDSYCVSTCSGGDGCSADTTCTSLVTTSGAKVSACVPRGDVCGGGGASGSSGASAGSDAGGNSGGSGSSSSGGGSGGSSGSSSGGPPPTGSLGPTGGTASSLYFAIVGDTRPATIDDTADYPTAIITKIFQDITSYDPVPLFGISTGDYMFATPQTGGQAQPQLDLYLKARGSYLTYPAMGNHECTGNTNSNCGPNGTDGITDNYTQFMNGLMKPLGNTTPYYSINIKATDGSWTSKFVFVAANAWDSSQQSWLQTTLAQTTTYTFVVRHESSETSGGPPGESGSDSVISQYPYTLLIVGHTHTYQKAGLGPKEVIIGNGGAPLTGLGDYGFGLAMQRSDGAIQVDMIDYQTLQPDTTFRFAVKPDGSPAP